VIHGIRLIPTSRHLISYLLATLSVIAVAATVPAYATPPGPDPLAVTLTQLQTIAQQNEHLSEQLNLVDADIASKHHTLAVAQADARAADANYATQRTQLAATFAAQYEGGSSFSQTGALLNSSSVSAYADKVTTLDMMSTRQTQMLAGVAAANDTAAKARTTAERLLQAANAQQQALVEQQAMLAADEQKYDAALLSLTVQQRTAYLSYGEVSQDISQYLLNTGPPAAQTAVNFALEQVGKPYVFDAAGPATYDCSGLTMAAWAAAGVTLPHNAAAQYNYGTHIAETDLQPGDLIFMYQPIDHVTIYIGYGLMVSAPEPGEDVKIVTVASEQDIYTGATRLT
jgi:peptidoglycan DL-endopeptidase CwlO